MRRLARWLTETEEERLARQAKQAEEDKQRQLQKERQKIRKQKSDTWMIQNFSSSKTDSKGKHHIFRWWGIVSLKKPDSVSRGEVV
jgi:hypothetical protein